MTEETEEVAEAQGSVAGSGSGGGGVAVIDVTDADFAERVLEGSKERPVVVDFWASWCAPCRSLGPILEKLADEKDGEFLLARVDVDANQLTAAQFGIQSIPTVIGFTDGRPVSQFMGALPEPTVRDWLNGLLPTEADRVAFAADEAERAGRVEEAEAGYRAALARDQRNRTAALGLARLLAERGGEIEEILAPILPDPEAERLLATARVSGWAASEDSGDLAEAKRVAAQGRWAEALDRLIALVPLEPGARDAVLDLFAVLGEDDPLTRSYRGKLASALF